MRDLMPRIVREIAEVVGREKALRLAGAVNGRGSSREWRGYLHIPRRVGPDHFLVQVLGQADADALCREFAGIVLEISSCACMYRAWRNQTIVRWYRYGLSHDQIAQRVGLTTRQVRNVLHAEMTPEAEAA